MASIEHADFPILSDPDKKVANADPNGMIAAIDKEVKPAAAGEAVVARLAELGVKKRPQKQHPLLQRCAPDHRSRARRGSSRHGVILEVVWAEPLAASPCPGT